MFLEIVYSIYMHKKDLALKKTFNGWYAIKLNQTKPNTRAEWNEGCDHGVWKSSIGSDWSQVSRITGRLMQLSSGNQETRFLPIKESSSSSSSSSCADSMDFSDSLSI